MFSESRARRPESNVRYCISGPAGVGERASRGHSARGRDSAGWAIGRTQIKSNRYDVFTCGDKF